MGPLFSDRDSRNPKLQLYRRVARDQGSLQRRRGLPTQRLGIKGLHQGAGPRQCRAWRATTPDQRADMEGGVIYSDDREWPPSCPASQALHPAPPGPPGSQAAWPRLALWPGRPAQITSGPATDLAARPPARPPPAAVELTSQAVLRRDIPWEIYKSARSGPEERERARLLPRLRLRLSRPACVCAMGGAEALRCAGAALLAALQRLPARPLRLPAADSYLTASCS